MGKSCKFGYCKPCLENSGIKRTATWLLPQSTDAGNRIEFIMACDDHHEGWWDGADWDGKHLEINLAKLRKKAKHSPKAPKEYKPQRDPYLEGIIKRGSEQ